MGCAVCGCVCRDRQLRRNASQLWYVLERDETLKAPNRSCRGGATLGQNPADWRYWACAPVSGCPSILGRPVRSQVKLSMGAWRCSINRYQELLSWCRIHYLLSVSVSYTSTSGIDARALDSPALRQGMCNLNVLCTFGNDLSFDIPKCFVMTCDIRVFYLPITF
jgi:hypothetical protein